MHRACVVALALLLGVLPRATPADDASSADAVRRTASRFLEALVAGDPAQLRPLLPERGKVTARLERFGPAQGSFSAGQIEALFRDFFRHGSVRSFVLDRVEVASIHYAVVRGRSRLIDREGAAAEAAFQLGLEPEGDTWVVREIREDPP
jgi:hypothetical protein